MFIKKIIVICHIGLYFFHVSQNLLKSGKYVTSCVSHILWILQIQFLCMVFFTMEHENSQYLIITKTTDQVILHFKRQINIYTCIENKITDLWRIVGDDKYTGPDNFIHSVIVTKANLCNGVQQRPNIGKPSSFGHLSCNVSEDYSAA